MKHMRMVLAALVSCALVAAVWATASSAAQVQNLKSYGKGGGPFHGIAGTVSDVGSLGFTFTTGKDTLLVRCNVYTKFTIAGQPASASDLKAGSKIHLIATAYSTDQVTAQTVDIIPGDGKPTTKPAKKN